MMFSPYGQPTRAISVAQPPMAMPMSAFGAVGAVPMGFGAYNPPLAVGGYGVSSYAPAVAVSYGAPSVAVSYGATSGSVSYVAPSAYPSYGAPLYGAYQPQVAVAQANVISGGFGGNLISGSMGGMVGGLASKAQNLLENRSQLKEAVIKAFKAVAGGQKAVDINGMRRMRTDIAAKLGVPESMFGGIEDEYIRFDFEGTGFLEPNEIYKLIKWQLYAHVKAQDAALGKNAIPTKSIQQAGYTITSELGAGNQASLKLACDQYGNQRAIKVFPKQSLMNMFSVEELQEEFETMRLLACKNIARTFEMFQDYQSIYMVNEVYHGGDFRKLREKATATCGSLSENWWKDVYRQCLEALVFMHQQAMMHCDVKEPNLMMRTTNYATPQVVLIDFGVSKAMTAKDTGCVSGTPGYMPPETMSMGKWYPGGDVFSLGVVIYQMMTGKIPDDEAAKRGAPMIGLFLEGCTAMEHVMNAVNTRQPAFHTMQCSPQLQQLCARMLEKNMRARPKAPTCLKDPWFSGFSAATNIAPIEAVMGATHPLATSGIAPMMLRY